MSGGGSGRRTVESDDVLIARDGPVLTLTFNRPAARNALTWAMYERLTDACEEVDADDSIRVVVLRGAGGQAFVAGTDVAQFRAFSGSADGIAYERGGDRHIGRLARPTPASASRSRGPSGTACRPTRTPAWSISWGPPG